MSSFKGRKNICFLYVLSSRLYVFSFDEKIKKLFHFDIFPIDFRMSFLGLVLGVWLFLVGSKYIQF